MLAWQRCRLFAPEALRRFARNICRALLEAVHFDEGGRCFFGVFWCFLGMMIPIEHIVQGGCNMLKPEDHSYPHTNVPGDVLYSLFERLRPRFLVEVGSFKGGSSIRIVSALLRLELDQLEAKPCLVCIDTFLGDAAMWLNKQATGRSSLLLKDGCPQLYMQFMVNTAKLRYVRSIKLFFVCCPVKASAFIIYCTWNMAMNQYLLIPFLEGWTSIYQLFWCSPGVQGFDTLPYDPDLLTFVHAVAQTFFLGGACSSQVIPPNGWNPMQPYPIGSMYGIYANIWGILMANVTIYIAYMDPMGMEWIEYHWIPSIPQNYCGSTSNFQPARKYADIIVPFPIASLCGLRALQLLAADGRTPLVVPKWQIPDVLFFLDL